jgi:DNA-binding MarR family transcriptional regulator
MKRSAKRDTSLTPKGRSLLEQVSPAFNPVYEEIEACFGIDRIEDLNKRLAGLLAAIQATDDEG